MAKKVAFVKEKGFRRKKGESNVLAKRSLSSILTAFDGMGKEHNMTGDEYFANWARENPAEFYKLFWSRCIPKVAEIEDVNSKFKNKQISGSGFFALPEASSQSFEKVVEAATEAYDNLNNNVLEEVTKDSYENNDEEQEQ